MTSAADYVPDTTSLKRLWQALQDCRGCDLYKRATQGVLGEGPKDAPLMLVGEQPGDKEDIAGEPFVGPAGKLLDKSLEKAGIDRSKAYVTNAVKHFKFKVASGGKRRLHAKPTRREVVACRPWLEAEMEAIKPDVVVCLGATAAQSLLGPDFRVTRQRGRFVPTNLAPNVMATVHPSALLRTRGDREAEMEAFVADLKVAADRLADLGHL